MRNLKTFELYESKKPSYDSSRIVYHGTQRTFDKFKVGAKVKHQTYGGLADNRLGIFFTDNMVMAERFAGLTDYDANKEKYVRTKSKSGRVVKAKVRLKNPYVIDSKESDLDIDSVQMYFNQIANAGGADEFREDLQSYGYDGIWLKHCDTNYYEDGTYEVIVAFSPEQIEIVK